MSKPYLLVINAAEGLIQYLLAAVQGENATILAAHSWKASSQGVELLAPALQNCFQLLSIKPQELGKVACVLGPGSFTGIRLGQITAAGLSRSTGALQGGVYYMPLLASAAKARLAPGLTLPDAVFWVVTHARQGLVHAQRFQGVALDCAPEDVEVLEVGNLSKRLAAETGQCFCLGSGVARNQHALAGDLQENAPIFLPERFNHPAEHDLLAAALRASYGPADLSPFYARACDAEDNLEHIAGLLHLDPQDAKAQLAKLMASGGTDDQGAKKL